MPRLVDPFLPAGALARLAQPDIAVNDGLVLRPWRLEDVDGVVEAYADPEVQMWLRRSLTPTEGRQLVAYWIGLWSGETDAVWAISEVPGAGAIGYIALHRIDLENGSAQVAYWVVRRARGHAVASDATRALSDWALSTLGLHRLELHHSVTNAASCRVAAHAGFELEGTLRSALQHPDGWHDMHLHSRLTTSPRTTPTLAAVGLLEPVVDRGDA